MDGETTTGTSSAGNAGEHHGERHYTVEMAAEVLHLTPGRVRQRLRDPNDPLTGTPPDQNGPQRGWRIPARVVMEELRRRPPRDVAGEQEHPGSFTAGGAYAGELIDELRDRVRFLEGQLRQEREARERADHIVAGLIQRIPELEAPATPEARESDVSEAEPGPTRTPTEAAGASQTDAQPPRSWWRRLIGE